ncbi:MAG: nucleotidyltransferase family protein [Anaerolineae bacterium]|jgi:predicted nucleotidyltransferase|nr:nucleotidyltransferase family protein [Anaerolineae bacterium]
MKIDMLLQSKEIKAFCKKNHIRKLSFFGSVIRNDFGQNSDIDVLVEFEAGHTPGYDFFLMEEELSHLLKRKVDLQTPAFLSPEIRGSVLDKAVIAYERA